MENSRNKKAQQVSYVGLAGNLFLAILKGVFGFIFGSAAVIADAFHSLSDLISNGVVILGLKLASRPPDESHHYGHGKVEPVAAKIVAIILIITGVSLLYSFAQSIMEEVKVPKAGALWVAVISILIKELMYQYVSRMGKKLNSSALMADAWHNRSDALSSLAALIGVGGARLGFPELDLLAGGVVALLILRMGFKIYLRSIQELIDTAPSNETIEEIRRLAISTSGARNAREIKARKHGMSVYVDLKICVDKDFTVERGHDIAASVRCLLEENLKEVENVFVHIEPCKYDECIECTTDQEKAD